MPVPAAKSSGFCVQPCSITISGAGRSGWLGMNSLYSRVPAGSAWVSATKRPPVPPARSAGGGAGGRSGLPRPFSTGASPRTTCPTTSRIRVPDSAAGFRVSAAGCGAADGSAGGGLLTPEAALDEGGRLLEPAQAGQAGGLDHVGEG